MTDPDRHTVDGEPRQYDRDTASPCSHAVVSAVATHLDCSPLDLEPLYLRVDPDALRLVRLRRLYRRRGAPSDPRRA